MEALKIEFQPNLKSKIIDFLKALPQNEVKIFPIEQDTSFDPNFAVNKKMLDKAYESFKKGQSKTYTIDEVDAILDKKFADYDS